jgi:uncharacterized protein (TIGR02145 family)
MLLHVCYKKLLKIFEKLKLMKKQIIITLTFLLCLVAVWAQTGTITNIQVSQGTGADMRVVDILFDLSGNDATYDITLEVSFDNGSSYVAIDNENVTGDLTVAPGTGIQLEWDGRSSHSSESSNLSRLKITATTFVFPCGDALVDSRDSKNYTTVQIGTQCWMAENLNYETTNSWTYNNVPANGDIYGRLYNWDAALTACPSGWSLPSDDQWKQMEMALGMSESEANGIGWRGTDEGGEMKETGTIHWNSPNTGATNTSGFTALPGGYRDSSGSFNDLGYDGSWWSSTEGSGTSAWHRSLYYSSDQVLRDSSYDKVYGFSIRCLKD